MEKPLVSIIILNYNAGDFLEECISSIESSNYDNYEIILVDNNSHDQSHLKCKKRFPKIKLIQNSTNLGYCEGNNVGIRNSKGEFIIILNPDTIIDHSCISNLILAHNENGNGLYQPKICWLRDKTTILSTGNFIQLFGFGFARDKGLKNENYSKIEKIGYPSGTCIFTSMEIMKKLCMFDPFIFLYHDDLDLGWRAQQLGIDSFFVPSAIVYHEESYNLRWSAKKFYWLERNRKYCLLTHYSKETYKKIIPYLVLIDILVWLFYLMKGFPIAKLKAEIDIWKNKKKIQSRCLEIKKSRIRSDKEIMKDFSDNIWIPKSLGNDFQGRIFNKIIQNLAKKARKKF